MIVEKIRNRNSAGKANEADKELPDKIYIDAAGLLSKYDPDPDELREEHERQSPAAT